MTNQNRLTMHKAAAALLGVALLAAGAGATYLAMRNSAVATGRAADRPSVARAQPALGAAAPTTAAPLPDVAVPFTPEAIERAGVVVGPVTAGTSDVEIRLPGVVEPNAYRQVVVTPLVAGRVTKVMPALGDRVRRGQTLAEIYSPALAEAQTRYVSARAMLEAHDRELQRTQKLVEIGAASRAELERLHAEHAAQTATVQSARAQLELLGVSASALDGTSAGDVSATTNVPAPIDGVVTERAANTGVNVDPATKLFTIVDLSTVWVVADVYEKDFSRVRVGSGAVITTPAFPDLRLSGHVSYIDPQISTETRTAKARIEVPNSRERLRLGTYVDVVVTGASGTAVSSVPSSAVQHVGDRTFVYVADPKEPGTFIEREVRVGNTSGTQVEIVSGVQPGDLVVTEGSVLVRAERERLGLRPASSAPGANSTPSSSDSP